MKKTYLFSILLIIIFFCFLILLKSLNTSNTYVPKKSLGKKIHSFNSQNLFDNNKINSDELFIEDKIYLLNIWASWCAPCRDEHKILMKLSKNPSLKIIGLNYKDNLSNAKKFVNKFGNPYFEILTDNDGTISIELGAYGVPESFILDKNKVILKKFIGALNDNSLKEIELLLK